MYRMINDLTVLPEYPLWYRDVHYHSHAQQLGNIVAIVIHNFRTPPTPGPMVHTTLELPTAQHFFFTTLLASLNTKFSFLSTKAKLMHDLIHNHKATNTTMPSNSFKFSSIYLFIPSGTGITVNEGYDML